VTLFPIFCRECHTELTIVSLQEDQCFSVVIGDKHKTLDLVAPDRDVKCTWVTGLKHLHKKLLTADLCTKHEMYPSAPAN